MFLRVNDLVPWQEKNTTKDGLSPAMQRRQLLETTMDQRHQSTSVYMKQGPNSRNGSVETASLLAADERVARTASTFIDRSRSGVSDA